MRTSLGQASRHLSQRYVSLTVFLLWAGESKQQMEFQAQKTGQELTTDIQK